VKTLGERLTALYEERRRRDITAQKKPIDNADINEAIGKTRNSGYFSRLRTDKRANPDPEALKKIADFFGVSFEWLVFGTGSRDEPSGAATAEQELLRLSVLGRGKVAPEAQWDHVDIAVYLSKGAVSERVIAEHRAELARNGIGVNTRDPEDHLAQLMARQRAKMNAAASTQQKIAAALEAGDELPALLPADRKTG